MLAHLNDPTPQPSLTDGVPDDFDEVIGRALAKQPAERYPSAGDLGRAAVAAASGRALAGPWRSVARGPAAPNGAAARGPAGPNGGGAPAAPATPRQAVGPTQIDWRPQPGGSLPKPRRRFSRAAVLGILTVAVAAAAIAAVLLTRSGARAPTPLRKGEVAGAVRAFAAAYGHRDAHALAAVLAPDVERISPSAVQRGRGAVLAEYRSQLTDRAIQGYRVENLQVRPGWVGRASAQYDVLRSGQPPFSGSVVFGIERVGGRPMIGLITTQPPG